MFFLEKKVWEDTSISAHRIIILVKKQAPQDAITPHDCFGCSVICFDWSYNIANYPTAFKNMNKEKNG